MCDIAVVVRPGRVLFAKNSDRDPNEAQALEWHPGGGHAHGTLLRCTWIEIPQARRTYAVLISRPFWMWGAEMGANEHGVVAGNVAVFTRRAVGPPGLTGMDLLRLALERATSADEALRVVLDLIDVHGQGGGCGHEHRAFAYNSSFVFADAGGAWLLETAGRERATQRIEGAVTLSNALQIPGFSDTHRDPLRTWGAAARSRRACTLARAEKADGVADLFALLRDHGPTGRPRYRWLNGALGAPCAHAGGLAAATQTTAAWVSELRPGRARHWATASAAPCTGLFKPVRVEQPLDLGRAPTDRFDAGAPWWRHERLHRRVVQDPERLLPVLAEERDSVEARWLATAPDPPAAFAEAERLLAAWSERATCTPVRDARPFFVRRYWRVRNRRAGLPLPEIA